jgi:uncharacterized protein YecT (DUF1311 family)
MRKYIACLILIGVLMADTSASELVCWNAKSRAEELQCLSADLDEADRILAEYLAVAKNRITRENSGKPQLDTAQAAWLKYRKAQCDDVYEFWQTGSYRFLANLDCGIELTRSRTHDIWKMYLTNPDSTPPLRPEPQKFGD